MNNEVISLPLPAHFSFEECLWFLNRNFDECLHRTDADGVEKVMIADGKPVLIRVTASKEHLHIHVLNEAVTMTIRAAVIDFVSNWFDLSNNLQPFYKLLKQNERLAYMPDTYNGLRLMGIPDLYEALCWCIIGQQINLTFAYKLKRRLVEQYGNTLKYNGITHYTLPDFETLANVPEAAFKAMQYSTSKAKYLVNIARAFADGTISLEKLSALPDATAQQQLLTSVKGIGIWSANYALMKCLRQPGAIPFGDSGLNGALLQHGLIEDKKDTASIIRFFEPYTGWESYLVFYLWRSLSKVKVG